MLRWRLCVLLVFFAHSTFGQWLNYPTPGTPRTRDGKPDLSAKAPRAPGGKPDLSGVWRTEPEVPGKNSTVFDVQGDYPSTFSRSFSNMLADFKNPEESVGPDAAELDRKYRSDYNSPGYHGFPISILTADIF